MNKEAERGLFRILFVLWFLSLPVLYIFEVLAGNKIIDDIWSVWTLGIFLIWVCLEVAISHNEDKRLFNLFVIKVRQITLIRIFFVLAFMFLHYAAVFFSLSNKVSQAGGLGYFGLGLFIFWVCLEFFFWATGDKAPDWAQEIHF